MTDRTTEHAAGLQDALGVSADLDRALSEVRALRSLGEAEDRTHDEARVYDASIRWGALVAGRLHRLALLSGRGALSAPERARYAELEEELRTLGPLLDRLGLPRPPSPSGRPY